MCGRFSHPREKGGPDTGPSPVDRRKTGSKHHLICDGRGTPLKVITTAANVNDVTQTLALVDSIPPVAGRPGRPRRRPESLLGDKGYDSNPNRDELRRRRTLPVISRKGSPSGAPPESGTANRSATGLHPHPDDDDSRGPEGVRQEAGPAALPPPPGRPADQGVPDHRTGSSADSPPSQKPGSIWEAAGHLKHRAPYARCPR
ncbi:transposase [Streptomyces sp. SID8350]|nr:transposase [Streptomyces sp. SID8350]